MISNFERKYGKYAIKNLTLYLIAGYVIWYMVSLVNPTLYGLLTFNPYMILHGQIWRIVTWVLTMPEELSIFTIIMLILYYQLGQTLERTWGTYRYNVYLISGLIFTVVGAIVLYVVLTFVYKDTFSSQTLGSYIGAYVSTYYINMSIFLAFAATYPEEQLMLYFIIPIKIKWFGVLYGAYILIDIYNAFSYARQIGTYVLAIITTVLIVMSLLNFILYFISLKKNGGAFSAAQAKRKRQYRQQVNRARQNQTYQNGARHKCAVCGRTELDDPNLTFRYCSKCSGNKEYCQDHLFTHKHM